MMRRNVWEWCWKDVVVRNQKRYTMQDSGATNGPFHNLISRWWKVKACWDGSSGLHPPPPTVSKLPRTLQETRLVTVTATNPLGLRTQTKNTTWEKSQMGEDERSLFVPGDGLPSGSRLVWSCQYHAVDVLGRGSTATGCGWLMIGVDADLLARFASSLWKQ